MRACVCYNKCMCTNNSLNDKYMYIHTCVCVYVCDNIHKCIAVSPCGAVSNVLSCIIVVSEFKLQSHYYIPFRTYRQGKGNITL